MNPNTNTQLEEIIRQSGEAWLIDWYWPTNEANKVVEAIKFLRGQIEATDLEAKKRFGSGGPDISVAALLVEYPRNPLRLKAFFQALGARCSPTMLVMAWRIIQGMEVKTIQFSFDRHKIFHIEIHLESPYGETDQPYKSDYFSDFKILRHIGMIEIDDRPVFDGFYPLRLSDHQG